MDLLKTTIVNVFWENTIKVADNTLAKFWKNGSWQEMTWKEYGDTIRKLCSALLELRIEKGDNICIMSNTRVEWGMIDLAILSVGGVTGCIYPTLLGKDASYIINDMRAKIVFVETKAQMTEIISRKQSMPQLEKVIVIEGLNEPNSRCVSLESFVEIGKETMENHQRTILDRIKDLKQDDRATVVYTSGTTGTPKGAVHNHRSIIYTASNNVYPFKPGMTDLSYLPMSHVFERFGGFFGTIFRGDITIGYFRGDMKGLLQDFQEIKPHVNRTAPRLLEKIYSAVKAIVATKSETEQKAFQQALDLADKVRVEEELLGQQCSVITRETFEGAMAFKPFEKIYQMLGGNMTFFYGGGASVPKEVTEFFFSIGIPVYELYGTSETIGTVTNYPGKVKPGTIGVPFPMVDWPGEPGLTRLSPQGEIENKGPNLLVEYLNKPSETVKSFSKDGWYKTGDLGVMDEDGFITITGRKKDIIVTSGGKNIAPQKIEDVIKESGYFSQVLVYGDNRKYLVALLTLDPMAIFSLAHELKIEIAGMQTEEVIYAKVANDTKTEDFVRDIIHEKNKQLFKQEQIVNYILLDRDLKLELDEITPTMKLKKKNVIAKFRTQLDDLYK
ncbi:AMP-binding protein [bacterium]|nr:AMP-binding protein [bacterium]